MTTPARACYAGYRFPAEIISHAVWLYFRFPLGLRMVEELLAARGIILSHETVWQWARKFGQQFAKQIRRRLPRVGDKWRLDEVALKIAGVKHWLRQAVDQTGIVLDVLVQRRRDKQAAKRLLRKLLKKQMRLPRVMITDKLGSYGAAKRETCPASSTPAQGAEQQSRKFAPADAPTRTTDEAVQFGRPGPALPLSPRPDQQPVYLRRDHLTAAEHRASRAQTSGSGRKICGVAVTL